MLYTTFQSIMMLILPFKWRFSYSTLLPSSALGYLEAPGTFMYGVNARHKTEVKHCLVGEDDGGGSGGAAAADDDNDNDDDGKG